MGGHGGMRCAALTPEVIVSQAITEKVARLLSGYFRMTHCHFAATEPATSPPSTST